MTGSRAGWLALAGAALLVGGLALLIAVALAGVGEGSARTARTPGAAIATLAGRHWSAWLLAPAIRQRSWPG